MFSFHKPKVYRSTQGCCICKAKSSSSRFTDSKKYELDFIECFQLETPRKGEICNACVLLVKRFKRLPPGSERHWGHVVDARVGPGLKSMTKFKKRKEEQLQAQSQLNNCDNPISTKESSSSIKMQTEVTARPFSIPEKFGKIFKKNKKKKIGGIGEKEDKKSSINRFKYMQETTKIVTRRSSHYASNNDDEDMLEATSTTSSPRYHHSDDNLEDIVYSGRTTEIYNKNHHEINRNFIETILTVHQNKVSKRYRRKSERPVKNLQQKLLREHMLTPVGHLDSNMWTRLKTCCGYVFECRPLNAIVIDADLYKMCTMHQFADSKSRFTIKTEKENSMINGNVKVTDRVNVPSTAVKKHHLYSKRQNLGEHQHHTEYYNKTDSKIVHSTQSISTQHQIMFSPLPIISAPPPVTSMSNTMLGHDKFSNNYPLHKLKSDGKIVKTINKVDGAIPTAKLKSTDLSLVKNLVKMCTDKTKKIDGKNENAVDPLGNKFSDNSSDSGYEETPAEQSMNLTTKLKNSVGVRSVVLANGIKVHVQPQNLIRAANWAGVPQTNLATLTQQAADKITFTPTVLSKSSDILLPVNTLTSANTITDATAIGQSGPPIHNSSATTPNLNQNNIILIKPKYLQQTAN